MDAGRMKKMRTVCILIVTVSLLIAAAAPCQEHERLPVTSIDQNEHGEWILLRDGEPWFRAGYFMPPNYSADELEHMVRLLAAGGFNHMHVRSMGVTESDFAQWLSLAESLDVSVAYSLHSIEPDVVRDVVSTWSDDPAIGCWYVDDVHAFTSKQLQALYDQIAALDPTRATDWSGGWRTDLATYLPTCDVFHRQFYPIWETDDGRNHERMYDTYAEAKALVKMANQTETVPGMDLQGAYSRDGVDFWPNAEETDLMFYMSAMAGIKGARWYPFGEVEGSEVWQKTQVIASELNSGLSDAFMLGKRTDGAISRHVFYGAWEYNGHVYVIVCNADDNESEPLSVPVPVDVRELTPPFDYRSSSLKMTEDGLTGSLPPLTVEIYRGNAGG
jgi:hypothetical protein